MNPEIPWSEDDLPYSIWIHHPRYDFGTQVSRCSEACFFLADQIRKIIPVNILRASLQDKDSELSRLFAECLKQEKQELYLTSTEEDILDTFFWLVEDQEHTKLAEKALEPYAFWLPLWLYDHSGLSISCGPRTYPYSDRWDSSALGMVFITKDEVLASGIPAPDENTWKQVAADILTAGVKAKDNYLCGDVYGYTLYLAKDGITTENSEPGDWEELDSCWGFLSDQMIESGMADDVGHGLKNALMSGTVRTGKAETILIKTCRFIMDK